MALELLHRCRLRNQNDGAAGGNLQIKGAFTFVSIAWSEPEFVCSPLWTAFILFYLGPNRSSFALSSKQLFTPLLCTFIYLRFWTVCFVYKASVHKALTSVLRMCCKCSKECWRRKEMRHAAFCFQRVSHTRQESEWNTHKHTFLSNNTALIPSQHVYVGPTWFMPGLHGYQLGMVPKWASYLGPTWVI